MDRTLVARTDRKRCLRGVVAALLLLPATSCGTGVEQAQPRLVPDTEAASETETSVALPLVVQRMPMNTGDRCVGIAMVTEVLAESPAPAEDRTEAAKVLADRIYDTMGSQSVVDYPTHVKIAGQTVPVLDRAALEEVSRLVAERYEALYDQRSQTVEGVARLNRAAMMRIRTTVELERILEADPDRMDCFCGLGQRWFPDGTVDESSHAFLVAQLPTGRIVVFDSNAPGEAQECRLEHTGTGLTITWSCPYRDTGDVTRQRYHIVPQGRYFEVVLGEERL